MSSENTLSLFKLEKEVEDNDRLLSLVALLLLFSNQKQRTLKKHKSALKKLYKKYTPYTIKVTMSKYIDYVF